MVVYPKGSYELDHTIVIAQVKDERLFGIVGFTAVVEPNRLASIRLKYWPMESNADTNSMTFLWTETSIQGKVQTYKTPGFEFEVAFQFRGARVKIPMLRGELR